MIRTWGTAGQGDRGQRVNMVPVVAAAFSDVISHSKKLWSPDVPAQHGEVGTHQYRSRACSYSALLHTHTHMEQDTNRHKNKYIVRII